MNVRLLRIELIKHNEEDSFKTFSILFMHMDFRLYAKYVMKQYEKLKYNVYSYVF